MKSNIIVLSLFAVMTITGCTTKSKNTDIELLNPAKFDSTIHGKQVDLYTLRNSNGVVAQFTNFGARWVSFWIPDKEGSMRDVVLGFDNLESYISAGEPYHGATVGRVCGRINNGRFTLNGQEYELANNDLFGKRVKNHLHGGNEGFHVKVWDEKKVTNSSGEESMVFKYRSPHMEEGYPGTMDVTVTYTLTEENEIEIKYEATTDRPTIVNLTNHSFFNLKGEGNGDVLDHKLTIAADEYIEADEELIPTGRIQPVEGTPLDFRDPAQIGSRIHVEHSQIEKDKGFAVAYALSRQENPSYQKVAELFSPESGIRMEILSDQPSLQFYNAWLFDGSDIGKQGKKYVFSGGAALETQGYSDAPNHPDFPSIALKPGEKYIHKATYRFSAK